MRKYFGIKLQKFPAYHKHSNCHWSLVRPIEKKVDI
jgi:hypothetical protein